MRECSTRYNYILFDELVLFNTKYILLTTQWFKQAHTLRLSSYCERFSEMISLCSSKMAGMRPCHMNTLALRRISAGENWANSDRKERRSRELARRFSIVKMVSDSTCHTTCFLFDNLF